MKPKTIYILSDKIKWKTFKLVDSKLSRPDSGPTPKNFNRVVWELLRDRRILCFYAGDGDMKISLEIPKKYKNWQIKIIK